YTDIVNKRNTHINLFHIFSRCTPHVPATSLIVSNEKSVDSVKSLAYNDIKTESLSVYEFKGMEPENAGI
ncbi:MAG: hypothetical protein WAU87_07090, partial [Agathobacter rectalis]